jgi:hypothetical protein
MVELGGHLATNAGVAICGAAVAVFPTSVNATQSTSVDCAVPCVGTTTTSSGGDWSFSCLPANTYDVRITCGSSVRWRRYVEEIQVTTYQLGDDGTAYFGAGNDAGIRWSDGDASNHALVVAVGDTSQQIHITDLTAIGTDWARSAGTHPELAIHSNTTPILDYLAIGNHDGTTASIDVVGGTTLSFAIAGNTEASITASGLTLPANSDLLFTGGTGTNDIVLTNGLADALSITDGSADVVVVDTSTSGNVITLTSALTVGSDGSGSDLILYSGTAGDNLTWDASDKVLNITGTDTETALDVLDGDVRIVDKLYFYDVGGEYLSSNGSTLAITGATTVSSTLGVTGIITATAGVTSCCDIDLNGNNIDCGGVIFLKEQACADADVAGSGQIWVDTATPNALFFTDDAGTDFNLSLRATTAISGPAELATTAETNTGSDTGRAVTPDGLAGSVHGEKVIQMVVVDFGTALTTGNGKFYFHVPSTLNGFNIVDVHAEVISAPAGSTIIIDLYNVTQSGDILSTNLTIDASETGSDTAAAAAAIDTGQDDLQTNDVIRVDIDQVGSSTAGSGLLVTLICRLP